VAVRGLYHLFVLAGAYAAPPGTYVRPLMHQL
jgi:hypothetical protein